MTRLASRGASSDRLAASRIVLSATFVVFFTLLGCADNDSPQTEADPIPSPAENLVSRLPQSSQDLIAASDRGRIHFDTYACWRCHTIGDEELPGLPDFDNLGPDLEFVGDRLKPELIFESLTDPNRRIAEPHDEHITKEGFSKMPPFEYVVSEIELIDLVSFLSGKKQSPVSPDRPIIVTEDSFAAEVSSSNQLILLDFWAEWCVPCLEIEPLLETIAADLGDQIKICKINVDDNPNLVADYVPDNMFPCLILMKDKKIIERVYGTDPKMPPKAFLDQWIGKHLRFVPID